LCHNNLQFIYFLKKEQQYSVSFNSQLTTETHHALIRTLPVASPMQRQAKGLNPNGLSSYDAVSAGASCACESPFYGAFAYDHMAFAYPFC
jgi:hypothetical protein